MKYKNSEVSFKLADIYTESVEISKTYLKIIEFLQSHDDTSSSSRKDGERTDTFPSPEAKALFTWTGIIMSNLIRLIEVRDLFSFSAL